MPTKTTHRVLRTFPAATPLYIGQEIDASDWANVRSLENTGYIAPLKAGTSTTKEAAKTEKTDSAPAKTEAKATEKTTTKEAAKTTAEDKTDAKSSGKTADKKSAKKSK